MAVTETPSTEHWDMVVTDPKVQVDRCAVEAEDGNGRTGRALLQAHLRQKRLTRNVTVPVSAGLLTDADGYFDALTAYRAGDPVAIVTRLARAAFAAVANGRELVQDLHAVGRWDIYRHRGYPLERTKGS
jgi:hypothetical protein